MIAHGMRTLAEYTFPRHKLRPVSSIRPGKRPAVIVACGSFNPVTLLHLRLFENARDNLNLKSPYEVIGGYFSPVNDGYQKAELASAVHRIAMCRGAESASEWIMTDDWESLQPTWQRTRAVLDHFEEQLNVGLPMDSPSRIRVLLLCGSDLLASFLVPGVWNMLDVRHILDHHGVVVIEREGADPQKLIHQSDLLHSFSSNIYVFREWILNDVSATEVRRLVRRGLSIKYLTVDPVVQYIQTHGLYQQLNLPDWEALEAAFLAPAVASASVVAAAEAKKPGSST